jgi:dihydrofolate reductase
MSIESRPPQPAALQAERPQQPRLLVVAAVAANGVIGHDNRLLWRLPEDLRHFRALTMGHPVIMGRKTWDSLPAKFRPLPGRRNLVVTRHAAWQAEGAEPVSSLDEALARLASSPQAFVIGGGELYALALPRADELHLTELARTYDGDTRFPAWDRSAFDEVSREPREAADAAMGRFDFVHYRRRPAPAGSSRG